MRPEPVGRSGLGFARTQCANGEKKSELAPRACQTKKGGAFNALGGWLVSTPSAWASKPFWGKKKNPFLCTECSFLALSSAGTDPGRCRDRMAARLHFGFFSTAGSRRDAASCKIRHLGTKTIDIIYQSFLSAPVALGAAELATLKGLVLAAMPGLTSGLKPPLKTTKS